MRVAIFIDGKNYYAGWRDVTGGAEIDFRKLAPWIVRSAGGTTLMGVHYFTGVDESSPKTPAQERLDAFLDALATTPGFFIQRFAQKHRSQTCPQCGAVHGFSKEKEVDTSIVADMLRLAAVDGFDAAVLVSGDADLVPAVEGVRALGKQVFVASWGASGLAPRLRRAAFDHLDLARGLAEFAWRGREQAASGSPEFANAASSPTNGTSAPTTLPHPSLSGDPAEYEAAMLSEIRRAQAAMPGGYVGAHFFVTKWRSSNLPEIVDFRRRVLDRVIEQGKAEVYLTDDGIQAVRLKS